MFNRTDTWGLLALLSVFLVCCLAAAWGKIRCLDKKLAEKERALDAAARQREELRMERDIALARDEAKRCHYVRLQAEENERLKQELMAVKAKNKMLEAAMNRYWPGARKEKQS